MRTNKTGHQVRPGLVRLEQRCGWLSHSITETTWIFEGTEEMLTHPEHTAPASPCPKWGAWTPRLGILEYGTIKVKGREDVITYRVGMRDAKRLEPLGWMVIGRGMYYAYVSRGDKR